MRKVDEMVHSVWKFNVSWVKIVNIIDLIEFKNPSQSRLNSELELHFSAVILWTFLVGGLIYAILLLVINIIQCLLILTTPEK
jgi:hypothetical protein